MTQTWAALYVLAAGTGALVATTAAVPVWVVIIVPVLPVVVGYMLTRGKLQKQDAKVQEIHVLVNSRLSQTLDALQAALVENVRLKDRLGDRVTQQERAVAESREPPLQDSLPIPELP